MTDPMAALRARFVTRAAEDLEALRGAPDAEQLRHVVHRLSGAAGVFGFAELSRLARVVDEQLDANGAAEAGDLRALDAELEAVALRGG